MRFPVQSPKIISMTHCHLGKNCLHFRHSVVVPYSTIIINFSSFHILFWLLSLSESVIQGLMIVNVLRILVPCVVLIKPQFLSVSGPRYLQQRQMTNENKSMTCHRGGDTTTRMKWQRMGSQQQRLELYPTKWGL